MRVRACVYVRTRGCTLFVYIVDMLHTRVGGAGVQRSRELLHGRVQERVFAGAIREMTSLRSYVHVRNWNQTSYVHLSSLSHIQNRF